MIRRCPACMEELEVGEVVCGFCNYDPEPDEIVYEFEESLDWDDEITSF